MTNIKSVILSRFHAPITKLALSLCAALGIASAAQANFVMKTGTTTANWSDEGLWVGDDGNYVIDYNSPNADITFTAAESIASGFWIENADGLVVFEASDPSYGLTMTGGDMHVGGANYGYLKISSGTHTFAEKLYVAYSQAWWENPDPTSKGSVTVDYGTLNVVDSVVLGNISGSDGAIYLNGGTLATKAIVAGDGSGKVEFYGGALKATATGTLIGSGLTVNVPAGYSGTIDTSGFAVTVESAVGGSGTLNIVGGGRVTFTTMPSCRILSTDDTPYVFPVPTYYWIGGSSGDWNNGANWSFSKDGAAANEYPNAGDALVKITSRTTISVGATYYVGSLYIDDGVVVTLTGGGMLAGIRNLGESATVGDKIVLDGVNLESVSLAAGYSTVWYADIEIADEATSYIYCNNADNGSNIAHLDLYGNMSGKGTVHLTHDGNSSGRGGVSLYGNNEEFEGVCYIHSGALTRGPATFCSEVAGSAKAKWLYVDGVQQNTSAEAGSANVTGWSQSAVIKFGTYEGLSYIFGFDNPIADGLTIEIGGAGRGSDFECGLSAKCRTNADRGHKNITLEKAGDGVMTFKNDLGQPYVSTWKLSGGTLRFANSTITNTFDAGGYSGGTMKNATFVFTGGTIAFTDDAMVDGTLVDISSLIKNSSDAISVYVDTNQSLTWATALDSSNKGGLIKDGAGTLTLGAVPQYSGSTVVQNGELVVPFGYSGSTIMQNGKLVVPFGTALSTLELGANASVEVDMTGVTPEIAANTTAFSVGTLTGDKDRISLVNLADGVEFELVETSAGLLYVNGSREFTWIGPSDEDYSWSNVANWSASDGQPVTIAPSAADRVVFNTATPGFTLSEDTAVMIVTVNAAGFTYNAGYALNILADFTVEIPGALTIAGTGSLNVGGTMSGVTSVAMTPTAATSAIVSAHPEYTEKISYANGLALTSLTGGGTIESDSDQTVTIAEGTDTFYGTLSGAMGIVKAGAGTLELQGPNKFTGNVAINGGTLALSVKDYSSLIAYNFDASDTSKWSLTSDNEITQMRGAYGWTFKSVGSSYATLINNPSVFGGKTVMYLPATAAYRYNIDDKDHLKNKRAFSVFTVYQASSLSGLHYLHYYTYSTGSNWDAIRLNGSSWESRTYNEDLNWALYLDGGRSRTAEANNKSVVSLIHEYAFNNNRNDQIGNDGSGFDGYVAEVVGLNQTVSIEHRASIDAYLMQKWGCTKATSYQFIPSTANVTMKSGATLDLGGMQQTVASFTGAGTVTNGYLKTTGDLTVDGGTLTIEATAGQTYVLSDVETERLVLTGNAKGYTIKVPDNAKIVGRFVVPEGISVGFEGEGADVTVVNAPKGWSITSKPVAGGILYRVGSFPFVLKLR